MTALQLTEIRTQLLTNCTITARHTLYILNQLQTKINLKFSFISGFFVQNMTGLSRANLTNRYSQFTSSNKRQACLFLDTQPIPNLDVYETECTEHPLTLC